MRVYWGIALSIVLHFLLYGGLTVFPQLPFATQQQALEISLIESPPTEKPPLFVRDQEIANKINPPENDKPTPFKSAQTIRVKQQTRAANIGLTKNRNLKALTQIPSKAARPAQPRSTKQSFEEQDIVQKSERTREKEDTLGRELEKALSRDRIKAELENGLSTVGEELPQDIKIGSVTALNTDRYLYYSFYARVEELIRFRWESLVEEVIQNINPRNINSQNKVWTTYMEVTLTPKGEYVRAVLLKESGIKAFDLSALRAFADAKFFPNPPHELVKKDGLIHLKYGFNVHYNPRPFVQR